MTWVRSGVQQHLRRMGCFDPAIGLAVMANPDTDCNGGTAGSTVGCALRIQGIPAHWTDLVNGRVRAGLKGLFEIRISDTGEQMYRVVCPSRPPAAVP